MAKSGSSKLSWRSVVEALWICLIFYCAVEFINLFDGGDPRNGAVACIAGLWLVYLFPVEDEP